MTDGKRNARLSAIAAMIVVVILTGSLLFVWSFYDQLPAQVATHWGLGREPNGFSSRRAAVLFPVIMTPLFLLVLIPIGIGLRCAREIGAASVGLATVITWLFDTLLWEQRGLADPQDARMTCSGGWDSRSVSP